MIRVTGSTRLNFTHRRRTMRLRYDRITTTIEREWLAEIIAGTKKIEYRQIKPYWTRRFEKVSVPFELRLLNGMNPAAVGDGHEAGCASRLRRNHDVEGLDGHPRQSQPGLVQFGLVYGYLAQCRWDVLLRSHFWIGLGLLWLLGYILSAQSYWFRSPLIGVSLVTLFYLAGLVGIFARA